MIKETVLQHKAEKERFISESKKYIIREKIPYAEKFLNENIIKVITGPRRAGKSVFCMLLLKDKEFAYLNFDDENLVKIKNYDELIKVLYEIYPNAKYFFFDEIQNLDRWELFINKLQRRNFNLIITGSNAKLLETEVSSVLTGKYVSINVFPNHGDIVGSKQNAQNFEKLVHPPTKVVIL